MHILHIANDYSGSKVYKHLFTEVDCTYGIQQTIYTAIRSNNLLSRNKVQFKNKRSQIIYSHVLNLFTKILYNHKLNKIMGDIEGRVDLTRVSLIHAHTWYSDGGVALRLSQKYKIPFVVTVRSSDTDVFFRYMFHLRAFGRKILSEADRIIFVTPIYRSRVLNNDYFVKMRSSLIRKAVLIPNAIDEFWHKNYSLRKAAATPLKTVNLLYVGTFIARKNVLKILQAVEILRNKGMDINLTLVGGGGEQHVKVLKSIKNKPYFNYEGKVDVKPKLLEIFRNADIFVMPSERETFGLVYLEAMSQGLPLIFLRNDGVDGLFNSNIGRGVNKRSLISEMVSAVQAIADKPSEYNFSVRDILSEYTWSKSAKKHIEIYNHVIGDFSSSA